MKMGVYLVMFLAYVARPRTYGFLFLRDDHSFFCGATSVYSAHGFNELECLVGPNQTRSNRPCHSKSFLLLV